MKKNTGKGLESLIESQAKKYELRQTLLLRKVDPPTRTINTNAGKYTMLLENPFLDFIGCKPCGKMVCIEAKSTSKNILPFGKSGIRQKQLDIINMWNRAGAIVGVIWQNPIGFYWVDLESINKSIAAGRKSVTMELANKINSENGNILDFLKYIDNEN